MRKGGILQRFAVDESRLTTVAVGLFGLNLILLALAGPFVRKISTVHLLVATIAGVQGLLAVFLYARRGFFIRDAAVGVFLLYFLLVPGYSLWMGHPAGDIIRGIVPFLFFPLAYFSVVTWNWSQTRLVVLLFAILSVLISLEVVPFLLGKLTQKDPYYRLTAYSDNAHLPYYIAALALVGGNINRRLFRVLAYSTLLLAILFTKSKGQVGEAFLVLVALSLLRWKYKKRRWPLASDWKEYGSVFVIVSVVFFGVNYLSNTNVFQDGKIEWGGLFDFSRNLGLERYSVEGLKGLTTQHRMQEFREASKLFLENPVLGAGPGATFEFESPISNQVVTQRYIHNAPFYFLATGGVVGLAVSGLPLVVGMIMAGRAWKNDHARRITVAMFAILLYTLISANFKLIQFNVVLGLLIGALSVLNDTE